MSTSKDKYKVAKEVAEAEFVRLCESNRIEHDTAEMSTEDLKGWTTLREDIVRDIRRGTLTVGEDGRPTFTPYGSTSGLTFNPPTGATLISAKSKPNDAESMALALADMARVDRGTFSKLNAKDYFACSRIFTLFLAD